MIQDNEKEKHEERNPIDERYDALECSVKKERNRNRSSRIEAERK